MTKRDLWEAFISFLKLEFFYPGEIMELVMRDRKRNRP